MTKSLHDFLAETSNGQTLWPTSKEEAWKYFDFKKLKSFENLVVEKTDSDTFEVEALAGSQKEILIGDNRVRISQDLLDVGVKVSRQDELRILNTNSKIDQRFLNINKIYPTIVLGFEAVEIPEPIRVKFNFKDTKRDVVGTTVKYDVKNSNVSVYELFESKDFDPQTFVSVFTQVEQVDSRFRHFVVEQSLPATLALLYSSEASLGALSTYKLFLTSLNSQFVRNQNNVHILKSDVNAEVLTFVLAGDTGFSESRTEIAHYEPNGVSRQLFKAIVADEARAIFNGRIYIDPVAQKTDSAQSCKGLLLGEKAQMNAKPELEIYADDVKAAHGAAIGQVSSDEVFYLLSRGISPEKAYELLAQAFAGEVIQGISDLQVRKDISVKIKEACAPVFADLIQSYKAQDTVKRKN